jgi:probable addiction module antidote protein
MKAAREFKPDLVSHLAKPKAAAAYLNAALEDGDPRVFLIALRDVAEAQGNMTRLARECKVQRESLYRMTSKNGNPSLDSVMRIIRCMGLKLKIDETKPIAA